MDTRESGRLASGLAALQQRLSLRRYWVVDAIPTGPTGELQRSRMADLLTCADVAPVGSGVERGARKSSAPVWL